MDLTLNNKIRFNFNSDLALILISSTGSKREFKKPIGLQYLHVLKKKNMEGMLSSLYCV